MTPEERSDITNAIWLCSDHAKLIDTDKVRYTIDVLKKMKAKHEESIRKQHEGGVTSFTDQDDLIAFGPNVIAIGALIATQGPQWQLDIRHFLVGSVRDLIKFSSDFASLPADNRYLLVNFLGEGRLLTEAPVISLGASPKATCLVQPPFPRVAAQALKADMKLGDTGDLAMENGDIAMVSGLDALPQKIMLNLSTQLGEMWFQPDFGTRIAEYYHLFYASPWLGRLLSLEAARLASIPLYDELPGTSYTPLQCVEKVNSVEPLADAPIAQRLPVRLDMEVKGVGRWVKDISILIPDEKPRNA